MRLFWAAAGLLGLSACSSPDFSPKEEADAGTGGTGGTESAGTSGSGGTVAAGSTSSPGGEGGSVERPSRACEAGDTRACTGPGACEGGQVCEDGTWSMCDCGGGDAGRGGSGSAGSGSEPSDAGASGGEDTGEGGANAGSAGAGQSGGGGAAGSEPAPNCTPATGSIELRQNTFLADGETFTIDDSEYDPVTFEFDCFGQIICNGPGGAPPVMGVEDDNVAVVFDGTEDQFALATLIRDAINAQDDDTLLVTASVNESRVSLQVDFTGARGNVPIVDTVANVNFKTSGMSGGSNCN